jgi:hypothetical protein
MYVGKIHSIRRLLFSKTIQKKNPPYRKSVGDPTD